MRLPWRLVLVVAITVIVIGSYPVRLLTYGLSARSQALAEKPACSH